KESLERIADRDPERALCIFDAVFQLMTQAVHRYEGTVLLETSDGITAAFGVPVAQEDHAVRACYAALQIQEAVRRCAQGPQDSAAVPVDYWRTYRSRHPQYSEDNRKRVRWRQRERRRRRAAKFVKMDSSRPFSPVASGTYLLVPEPAAAFA